MLCDNSTNYKWQEWAPVRVQIESAWQEMKKERIFKAAEENKITQS